MSVSSSGDDVLRTLVTATDRWVQAEVGALGPDLVPQTGKDVRREAAPVWGSICVASVGGTQNGAEELVSEAEVNGGSRTSRLAGVLPLLSGHRCERPRGRRAPLSQGSSQHTLSW